MGSIAINVERALALELGVTFAAEATFPVAAGAVAKRVLGAAFHTDINALSVLNVDGRTGRIGQRKSGKSDRGFQRTVHIELAIGTRSRKRVGNLICEVIGLHNAYVRAAD